MDMNAHIVNRASITITLVASQRLLWKGLSRHKVASERSRWPGHIFSISWYTINTIVADQKVRTQCKELRRVHRALYQRIVHGRQMIRSYFCKSTSTIESKDKTSLLWYLFSLLSFKRKWKFCFRLICRDDVSSCQSKLEVFKKQITVVDGLAKHTIS